MANQPNEPEVIGTVDPAAQPLPGGGPADQPPPAPPTRPSELSNEEPAAAVPAPQPAETVPQPGPGNLPPVDSVIAKQAAELGLRIVDAERDGASLFLVVEGDTVEDVQGFDARKLAYDARFHYGFDNAGIEPYAGAEPAGAGRYRQTWKLTRGL